MKKHILGSVITVSFLCFNHGINAQNSMISSGGETEGHGGSATYVIGQTPLIVNGNSLTLNGNLKESTETNFVTSINEVQNNLEISVHPNPTIDHVLLTANGFSPDELSYELSDINGVLLKSNDLAGQETMIDLSELEASIYFAKIIYQETELETIRIIKN